MPSQSLFSMMRARCDIKRVPAPVGGKAQDAQPHIGDQRCTPLLPLSAEAATRNGIESPAGRSVVYVYGDVDVRAGDVLVMNEKHMPIVAAGPYNAMRNDRSITEVVVQVIRTERR